MNLNLRFISDLHNTEIAPMMFLNPYTVFSLLTFLPVVLNLFWASDNLKDIMNLYFAYRIQGGAKTCPNLSPFSPAIMATLIFLMSSTFIF